MSLVLGPVRGPAPAPRPSAAPARRPPGGSPGPRHRTAWRLAAPRSERPPSLARGPPALRPVGVARLDGPARLPPPPRVARPAAIADRSPHPPGRRRRRCTWDHPGPAGLGRSNNAAYRDRDPYIAPSAFDRNGGIARAPPITRRRVSVLRAHRLPVRWPPTCAGSARTAPR